MTKRRHFNYVGSEEDSNPLRLGRRDTGGSTRTTDHSFMKTIDDVCGQPKGSFKNFIKQKDEILRKIDANRRERIKAHRAGLPLPELGFEVDMWMVA